MMRRAPHIAVHLVLDGAAQRRQHDRHRDAVGVHPRHAGVAVGRRRELAERDGRLPMQALRGRPPFEHLAQHAGRQRRFARDGRQHAERALADVELAQLSRAAHDVQGAVAVPRLDMARAAVVRFVVVAVGSGQLEPELGHARDPLVRL
jgi:hypothetical protein